MVWGFFRDSGKKKIDAADKDMQNAEDIYSKDDTKTIGYSSSSSKDIRQLTDEIDGIIKDIENDMGSNNSGADRSTVPARNDDTILESKTFQKDAMQSSIQKRSLWSILFRKKKKPDTLNIDGNRKTKDMKAPGTARKTVSIRKKIKPAITGKKKILSSAKKPVSSAKKK